ncbi:AAA family ATPase [Streptomyces sp. NPDC004134]|uniref:helix-turn-helix transcriptional regulator n=1 Tax=Streptomyces sp. NPDC004134 TaxID=3364691 RepID=UPI00367C7155
MNDSLGRNPALSPLVGRAQELSALADGVRRRPGVVLVEGEAGVGKSRLVHEVLASDAVHGLRVLVSRCLPAGEPSSYGPVLDALGTLLDRPAPRGTGLRGLSPVTGVLRTALPELAELLPEPPAPAGDPRTERQRLFRAVRELVAAVGPAILVVEDLHWADTGTRNLLGYLLAAPPPELAVVLTYRYEDLTGSAPLAGAYHPPPGTAGVLLRLRPLDRAQAGELAAAVLGSEAVPAEFAAELHERTAGIPFVIEETLRAYRGAATGELYAPARAKHVPPGAPGLYGGSLADIGVPVLLREAMAERLAKLPPSATRLAQAAAVLGVPAPAELLARVAGLAPRSCRSTLGRLLDSAVLHTADAGAVAFRHALARQAVYETVPASRRRELHRRVCEALREQEPTPLVQLAEHSERAGLQTDALRYAEQAADRAASVGDSGTSTRLLQRLLAAPHLSDADVNRLALKLGKVAHTGLDQRDPVAVLDRLVGDPRLSTITRGRVRLYLGLLLVRQEGAARAGRRALETALGELPANSEHVSTGVAILARPFLGTTPYAELEPWTRQVEDLLETAGGEQRLSLLASHLCSKLHAGDRSALPGPDPASGGEPDLGLPPARGIAELRQQARIYCNLADACTAIGHYGTAHALLERGVRAADEAGALFIRSTGESTQARLDWLRGDWDGLAERAAALLEEYRDLLPVAGELSLVLGSLAAARGDWARALRWFTATGVEAPQDAITPVVLGGYAGLVKVRLALGEPAHACRDADRGLALVRAKGIGTWAGELLPLAVEAYLAAGRKADAAEAVASVADTVAGREAPLTAAALVEARGRLAAADADHARAAAGLQAAQRAYEDLRAPYLAARAGECAVMSRLAGEGGGTRREAEPGRGTRPRSTGGSRRVGEATPVSEAADGAGPAVAQLPGLLRVYDRLGATVDASRCRALMRAHGARPVSRRGRRGYGAELSPREREVARLLADGRSNQDIAQVLSLSLRTAEHHVGRVLRKLGAVTRTELRGRAID